MSVVVTVDTPLNTAVLVVIDAGESVINWLSFYTAVMFNWFHVAEPAAPLALQKYNLPPLAMICPTVPAVPAEVGAAPDAATVNVVAVI